MGTPDFAVPTLQKLIDSNHEIIAVYTKAPKAAGRGYPEIKSKIHLLAEKHSITVYTPKSFKAYEDIDNFTNLKADIAVVAAYGLILPKAILGSPKYGCINVHPSKLPRWRGAAPIQHTILAGDKTTAVCIMDMEEGLDTGDVYLTHEINIPDTMTAKELHDITAEKGGSMVLETLDLIAAGTAVRSRQPAEDVAYAHKLSRSDEVIDWNKDAFTCHCLVRAFSPRPGAYFSYNSETIKIISSYYSTESHKEKPGTVLDDSLSIACGRGILKPTLLQREGRKMIYTAAFLRGFPIPKGSILP